MRLLFAELDRHWWPRVFITGPNQDGKTLAVTIIIMYLLFERRETVVFGVPSLDMVTDKWKVDLLPVIKASRYADLLPRKGGGSREGNSVLVMMGNGAALRFMTAGGDDQTRAGFTTPNLVVTETDGFDEVGGRSREGDKFSQLERRTLAYGDRARIIAECTVSIETARTWQEYQHGTQSRIALPCPHCGAWVTPEREHLVGWQDAQTEVDARTASQLCCPECGQLWSNEERIKANGRALLVHKGQEITPDGVVVGQPAATNTLGFRWTCVNSILNPSRLGLVGAKEWKVKRAVDEDVAERDVCQSEWALPAKPPKSDVNALDSLIIKQRVRAGVKKGFVPDGAQFITVGCDIGKWRCHWTAIAWLPRATPHVLDYGVLEVNSRDMGVEDAIVQALRDWRDGMLAAGWGDPAILPTFKFLDAGNWQDTIARFCQESEDGFIACKSFGATQRRAGGYKRQTGTKLIDTYDHYSLIELPDGTQLIEINADEWKSWLHRRTITPIDKPGALTLFHGGDHHSFAKHLTAEKQTQEFVPGTGVVERWEQVHANNHWLDATMLACVAGHAAGARLSDEPQATPPPAHERMAPPPQDRNWINSFKGRY